MRGLLLAKKQSLKSFYSSTNPLYYLLKMFLRPFTAFQQDIVGFEYTRYGESVTL